MKGTKTVLLIKIPKTGSWNQRNKNGSLGIKGTKTGSRNKNW